MRGLIDSDQMMECSRITNPIERDYQIKVAMGFPSEKFTRISDLLRKVD